MCAHFEGYTIKIKQYFIFRLTLTFGQSLYQEHAHFFNLNLKKLIHFIMDLIDFFFLFGLLKIMKCECFDQRK